MQQLMEVDKVPDNHIRKIEIKASNEAAAWEVMDAVEIKARAALLQVSKNIFAESVSVAGTSGSNYYRDTLAEGKAALAEEDDKVSTISMELSALSERGKSWTWQAKVWALAMPNNKVVSVKVTAHSRVVAEGIASTLEGHFKRRESREPAIPAASNASASGTASVVKESWLKRTWRDHAALLVITVVGTVFASLVLLWLGIR